LRRADPPYKECYRLSEIKKLEAKRSVSRMPYAPSGSDRNRGRGRSENTGPRSHLSQIALHRDEATNTLRHAQEWLQHIPFLKQRLMSQYLFPVDLTVRLNTGLLRLCVTRCEKIGKKANETYTLNANTIWGCNTIRARLLEWFTRFKAGRISVESDECGTLSKQQKR
jgi:hypothetical protein